MSAKRKNELVSIHVALHPKISERFRLVIKWIYYNHAGMRGRAEEETFHRSLQEVEEEIKRFRKIHEL